MTAQFARAPYRGRSGGSTVSEPHAALLIDFDNVTMGIRSDLTKELKNLLNSDIIKGKVAVQRAYADWRRYPQYIVPLAESSVDLIFAPAYGSAKKNATDIRLAIDAVELVFTRPEIGTIILLSGDSDFSSLVLKLKEYGKYVIGVGIRESASDLLVQNCDEYYSYSALTGLTRAGDEVQAISEDPWELVEMALRQMIENDDVMRSDRLKQVLLEMDPGFDEKALGFQKFNKFLQEAANRGIISLRKQENGQYEVGPPAEGGEEGTEARAETRESRESRESRSRRGRRGRGRREEREPRESREPREAGAESEAAAPALSAEEPEAAAAVEEAPPVRAAEIATPEPAAVEAAPGRTDGIAASYDLLRRAVSELTKKSGPAVRDSDVKRRMLEMQAGWDEAALGFSKFSRFLRTAHDAEIITLRKGDNGIYDVLLGDGGVHIEGGDEGRGGRRDRERDRGGRGRDRDRDRGRDRQPAGERPAAAAAADQGTLPLSASVAESAGEAPAAEARPVTQPPRETQATSPAAPRVETRAPAPVGFRRGSRGRAMPSGPPPLLEGQAAHVPRPGGGASTASAAPAQEPAPATTQATASAVEPTPTAPAAATAGTGGEAERGARKRGRGAAKAPAGAEAKEAARAGKAAESKPAAAAPAKAPQKEAAKKGAPQAGRGAEPQAAKAARGPRIDAVALGLPTSAAEMITYMSSAYGGVGPKSVQALIDAFGVERVYESLEKQPDRVREVMGAARGDRLLDAFADDLAARRANAAPDSRSVLAAAQAASTARKRPGPGRPGSAPRKGVGGGRDGGAGGRPRGGRAGSGRKTPRKG
jgi:uncharacterized protein (TIGR00288 family)